MDRLQRLTKGHQPLPRLSENTMQRISLASRRRMVQERHKREAVRITTMNARDTLEDRGAIIIPKSEASE